MSLPAVSDRLDDHAHGRLARREHPLAKRATAPYPSGRSTPATGRTRPGNGACTGSGRCSWPRSASPNGPTDEGRLRHPRFEGLRDDKDPTTVVRET